MYLLDEDLKQEIRKVFEPRYNKKISDQEVVELASSLMNITETLLKFRWRQVYEKKIQN